MASPRNSASRLRADPDSSGAQFWRAEESCLEGRNRSIFPMIHFDPDYTLLGKLQLDRIAASAILSVRAVPAIANHRCICPTRDEP